MGRASHGPATLRRTPCRQRALPVGAAVALAGTLAAGSALAGLNPNGNPTGAPTAWDPTTTLSIQLKPNPSVFEPQGNCPWLLPALQAASQPYNNANNVWKYTFTPLQGSLTLNSYSAWVNNEPAITIGSGASANWCDDTPHTTPVPGGQPRSNFPKNNVLSHCDYYGPIIRFG